MGKGFVIVDPLQTYLGFKTGHFVAGVAGGVVRALLVGGGWLSAITSVLVGSLTSSYLTPTVYAYVQMFPFRTDEYATSFLLGLTAMLLCEGVMYRAKKWRSDPVIPGRP